MRKPQGEEPVYPIENKGRAFCECLQKKQKFISK